MFDIITVNGIRTNNLKNINIKIKKNCLNLILGPSGSGKSSLAYDTIAQIGQHELFSMFSDDVTKQDYIVNSYANIIATVPIQQINSNNNNRSTIGTYFGINQNIINIFSSQLNIESSFFVLNKIENLCDRCKGIGYIRELDINRIINHLVPINNGAIKCWDRYKSFYNEVLTKYCIDEKIDYKKNFFELTLSEQNKILYGISDNKYTIKYKIANCKVSRTTKYFGIMTNKQMLKKGTINNKYYSYLPCPKCKGLKYSESHINYKVNELSIGEFMITPFIELLEWIQSFQYMHIPGNIDFSFNKISRFIKTANKLGLGHLFFHRIIPTLSGGEFQRLKLVQVFNTQLTDLLIVLDEPLAGLCTQDKENVYLSILNLLPKHTLLIVDHHDDFIQNAKNILILGKGSGQDGGSLISLIDYKKLNNIKINYKTPKIVDDIHIQLSNKIYQYCGIDIKLSNKQLNIITGKSGVGKTTLLKDYLPLFFEKYTYINQKTLTGKSISSVSTLLDINIKILNIYSKYFNKNKSFFSKLSNGEGACPKCKGQGLLNLGNEYQQTFTITCDSCHGTGYNQKLKKYKIDNVSIIDIWEMTINEALIYFEKEEKIKQILSDACSILLGHLKIGQSTKSLSGGENIRMKLLNAKKTSSQVIGVDEPFRGLSNNEIIAVINYLNKIKGNNKTIIVVDHEETSFQYFSKKIELINNSNTLTEKIIQL